MPPKMDECILNILELLGRPIQDKASILDFGCGNGDSVQRLLDRDIDAWGCDLQFKVGAHADTLSQKKRIRTIDMKPYRLPYDDNSFDYIYSNQVFEHVSNMDETIAELRRILKPDGLCVHIFPSKLKPIESHVYAPYSSLIKNRYWLAFWHYLGIGRYKGDLNKWESAKHYEDYLKKCTNYLNGSEIQKVFGKHFNDIQYAEREFLKQTSNKRGKKLYQLAIKFPPLFWIFRVFWSRVLVTS